MKNNKKLFLFLILFLTLLSINEVYGLWHECDRAGEECCSNFRCKDKWYLTCDRATNRCIDTRGGDGGSTPTACPTEPEGCYKENNGKVDAGTLKPAEFDFYRVQDKCLRPGSSSPNPTPPPTPSPTPTPTPSNLCGNGRVDSGEICGESGLPQCLYGPCQSDCKCPEPPDDNPPIDAQVVRDITGNAIGDQEFCNGDGCNRNLGEDCNTCPEDCGECGPTPTPAPTPTPSTPCTTCPDGSRDNPDEIRDPDARREACGCIKNSEYDSGGQCCGNEADDCGVKSGNAICRMSLSIAQGSSWVSASSNRGDTTDIPCSGDTYLSTGTDWIKCDGNFVTTGNPKILRVNSHEYLCRGFGPKSVVECCGNDPANCQSKDGSVERLTTGQWVNPSTFPSRQRPSFSMANYEAGSGCNPTTRSCNVVNGQICLFQHYSPDPNCPGECIQSCQTCSNNQCQGCNPREQEPRTCNINPITGKQCVFEHYSNCQGICIQDCPNGCNPTSKQCIGQTPIAASVVASDQITGDVTGITGMQGAAAQTRTVRGKVWNDANQNGILDSGESGIGMVNVRLTNRLGTTEIVPRTNTDGGTGIYQFVSVPVSNDLRINFQIPQGYRMTPKPTSCGTGATCTEGDSTFTFSLDSSGQVKDYNLGLTTSNCGNGNIDANEDCDGANLNSKTCATIPGGFTGGTLACLPITAGNNACKFDTRGCTGGQTTSSTASQSVNPCTSPIGSCDAPPGEIKYESDVRSAINSFISSSSNSQIASARNDDFNAVKNYLNGVAARLRSNNGFEAARTKNCNGNEAADAIIVRKAGDQYAEYYGIIINVGSGRTLRDTASIGYIEKANWNRRLPELSSYGNNMVYYCRADGTFTINLDTPGLNQQGSPAPADRNREACTTAGFVWTGTKCCGEFGICEYHNENSRENSCWSRTSRPSISLFENNAVILYEGNFHGCAIDETNYFPQNNLLLKLFDKGTNNALITNHDYCFNDPRKDYYCSYKERWLQTEGKDRTKISYAPQQNPEQAAECCAATECWNGRECIANQRSNPLAQPINNFRCIDGEWKRTILKCGPEGEPCGYCAEESQCMLNPQSQSAQNQCVNSGDYSRDNYCDNGVWSTRTKLLALKLLAMKSSSDDFTLFCDSKDNTLNNLLYATDSGEIASSIITNLDANNFCILKSRDKVVVGTSINNDISQVRGGFNIFGVTSCSNARDDNNYYSCDSTNRVWYNKKLKSLIYSANSISVTQAQETSSSLSDAIRNIINRIRVLITPPPFDESYVNSIKKFDKLYLAKQGSKTGRCALEGTNFKNLVCEYANFEGTDICAYTDSFNRAGSYSLSGISCKKEGSNYYVLVQGSQLASLDPERIWPDLTAKLRLR